MFKMGSVTHGLALLHQARWALAAVCVEMESYAAARSENWQESERGEEFAERLAALQEVLAAVEELTPIPEKTEYPLTSNTVSQMSC